MKPERNTDILASRLYIGDTHIWFATGVQQDDPLGPLLFALILHPLLHKIKDNCKLLLHAWYLDDETVIGDSEEVAKVIDIIKVSGPGLGLELNIKKTEIFWPSCNDMKLREGLFPVNIRRPSSGVKLLGGVVSRDTYFINGLAMRRTANAVDLISLLLQLHEPQSELLLLRSCMGIVKLFFGLKTCKPVHMEEAALFFDKGLRGSIENIVVCGGPFFGDLQWRLASLPIRFGGLGLYSAKLVSSYAFVASRAQSWVLQDHILRDSGICGMNDDYVSALTCLRDTNPSFDFSGFTNKDTKVVFACLRAPHAQDFLLAIPIDGLGQHMSPVEYRTILKYRLMIPLFPVDAICPVWTSFDICRHAGISAKKEAHVNFLTDPSDGRSTLRPADVLVFGWVGGKHACADLTVVSLFVGLSSRGFTVGQAALNIALGKVAKHEKAYIENQHVFILFAFDTFANLHVVCVLSIEGKFQILWSCLERNGREITEPWLNILISFPIISSEDVSEEPLIVEAEVEGYLVRRVYVDEGSSVEVMFEHYFENLDSRIKVKLKETQTDLVGRTVFRAPSPYNIILGMPGLKTLRAIPSTIHSMMKFPTPKGVATLVTWTIIIAECRRLEKKQMVKENSEGEREVAVTIGGGLSEACQRVTISGGLS
uniref:Uncharacterized protein n=1 Tax=Tanacetum cinerariifolium TaxID=118510 RepID=A0A6L2LT79_TANCI|nr:hypothetical protein [Tanacetum cinerariifolium]